MRMGLGDTHLSGLETEAGTRAAPIAHLRLNLLGMFDLEDSGEALLLPRSVQRVVAFLAIHPHRIARSNVACALWLDCPEERSQACLRSALWRAHRIGVPLIEGDKNVLHLEPRISVDAHEMAARAHALLSGDNVSPATDVDRLLFVGDLLPDWSEDWVSLERERLRQLRVHALENLAAKLTSAGEFGSAIEACYAAIEAEPLRESAHRALIRVHLAEGNRANALRQFSAYSQLLRRELGVEPSHVMQQLAMAIMR